MTNELFLSYLQCKYGAYAEAKGKYPVRSEYELLQAELESDYKHKAIEQVLFKKGIACVTNFQEKSEHYGHYFFKNHKIHDWQFNVLEKVAETSTIGTFQYMPVIFRKNNRISRKDKLFLSAMGLMLAKIQGKIPQYGKIIYGDAYRVSKIRLKPYVLEVKQIFKELQEFKESDHEPTFAVRDFCRTCQFCRERARATDDLSLLRGMTTKDIIKQHAKGIFTVTQYSYTFRPKKKRKRVKKYKNTYLFELKALAIREQKIFITEKPELPSSDIKIYFDIEGSEDNRSYYLIGLVVIEKTQTKRYSFWADNQHEEELILQQFLAVCDQYQTVTFFHYGSYELHYLKAMKKKFFGKYDNQIDRIIQFSVNMVAVLYSSFYFPTYSNELKDIANYLGFSWTDESASGLQSIVWRTRWEIERDTLWKKKLLQYNYEDCLALQKITELVSAISTTDTTVDVYGKQRVVWTKDLQSETTYRLGKATFFFPEFSYINKCAYFDYQRDKVFIRKSPYSQKRGNPQVGHKKQTGQPNKYVDIASVTQCPFCQTTKLYRRARKSKTVYDLAFSHTGVKKRIIGYSTVSVRCPICKKEYLPNAYTDIRSKYGHGLIAWVLYQIIANGVSLERINRSLADLFTLSLPPATIYGFKTYAAEYYQETYRTITTQLMTGNVIHADETKVNLKTAAGYVWVFTNRESVVFTYRDSREGEFLEEFLHGFGGVLLADFYAAYDSLNLPQQKCLIHLMRDLNHDIFSNPFDQELKTLVHRFAVLLNTIISTVDRYGLKKRHLYKHTRDVKRFFRSLKPSKSELAESYRKRFIKNKEKLFTFLQFDGVPWNNNSAEHALKHFATYRKTGDGIFTKSGIQDYLVLLSIYQTCQYKNINFLQFLLSQKKTL